MEKIPGGLGRDHPLTPWPIIRYNGARKDVAREERSARKKEPRIRSTAVVGLWADNSYYAQGGHAPHFYNDKARMDTRSLTD